MTGVPDDVEDEAVEDAADELEEDDDELAVMLNWFYFFPQAIFSIDSISSHAMSYASGLFLRSSWV